ncbi:MAG: colicin V production CvpA [Dehalococcoidales bacterium]|jgi:membrane protein required for colicin V production|nr:colicin V production CvpA [Dehalococcoidales bacterium]MDP6221996.1 CvpA family protein [Dehalococcoidales bacterium]MDP7109781.1 CvpA family protein [Dehalococcoidales bacterium]MDP7310251.1 CvpA family protein [Dehalococcoidales bacterium]MDP7409243.1 CvpA family protein [Dehalococcoidales bacterium]|tara:strand:- start:3410 stop:3886 length:477 start_codon:yes stop_codon:yes gene_type:complete
MNWLDIVIIAILVPGAFIGLRTGLIKASLSLAGLIVGINLAGRYYLTLAEQLTFIPQEKVSQIVGFTIILLCIMLIVGLLTRLTSMVMSGWVNRLGGIVFGLTMNALSISILLAIWIKFFGMSRIVSDSGLASLLLNQLPAVLALLPSEFDVIRSFFK